MEVYLVRHGPLVGAEGLCYGQFDLPPASGLTELAADLRRRLPSHFDAVCTSPAGRCRALAEALALGETRPDARLAEAHFGAWEGRPWADISPAELNPWMADFVRVAPPGGEHLGQLYARVSSFLDEAKDGPAARVLAVTHAGPLRCAWAYALDVPLANVFRLPAPHGSFVRLDLGPERPPAIGGWG